jgi:hypothetical protein
MNFIKIKIILKLKFNIISKKFKFFETFIDIHKNLY